MIRHLLAAFRDASSNRGSIIIIRILRTVRYLHAPFPSSTPQANYTMRLFHRLLMATPSTMGSKSSLSEALALLPPLQLYRRILRVHRRKLDPEMRILGDSYVKSEFRAHRDIENPLHIIGFLTEWQLYAQKLEGDAWVGEKLDKSKLEKMSDQQIGQLYELMQAIKNPDGEGKE
ncbi:acetate non-utilizing protein 9, mitochondrial [Aspergillus udagawae]|nr:acetate non-utilizing protein 9, mitochondrial [Aspergillus udagawae]